MKHFPTFIFSYVLLLVLSGATWSAAHFIYKPSKSIIHLTGARKGEDKQGIGYVKSYLNRFGYLDHQFGINNIVEDLFDDSLENAILTYQEFFKLNKTGVLDHDTISMMSKPRCGFPDILNVNSNEYFRSFFHKFFKLYPGKPRRTKRELNIEIGENVPRQFRGTIIKAFFDWAPFVPFKLHEISYPGSVRPDVKAEFFRRNHGDGTPFDGPGGTLAHATPVYGSSLHFDAEENWHVGSVPDGIDIGTVARHEFGHSLGLAHSDITDALMYPTIGNGVVKQIGGDDIAGIKTLYSGR